jgi:hypothetical protein
MEVVDAGDPTAGGWFAVDQLDNANHRACRQILRPMAAELVLQDVEQRAVDVLQGRLQRLAQLVALALNVCTLRS